MNDPRDRALGAAIVVFDTKPTDVARELAGIVVHLALARVNPAGHTECAACASALVYAEFLEEARKTWATTHPWRP